MDADETPHVESWLELGETFGEPERWTSVAYVAGGHVALVEEERNEAVRRALVVRAVGGDPQRELALDEDAVTRLAEELDEPARRAELREGLLSIQRSGDAGPLVAGAVARLLDSPDLAWRSFAAALLAAELADE